MPWNTQNGGRPGNGGRGPWGSGPGGGSSGGGGQPPDLEELLKRSQDRLRRVLPGGFGRGGVLVVGLIVVLTWLASGIYIVQPDQQGVVLRFGAYVKSTAPGINYHLPWPIETALTPTVTREQQINIGYQTTDNDQQNQDIPRESLMLTGDENIVDINFTVFWVVKNAPDFLFNVQNPNGNPGATIKAVGESAMREIVGENDIEPILTQNRAKIQNDVRNLMQQILDSYGAGVTVTRVQMQKADPPQQVIAAYRDVQAARTDQDRMRNEAEAYANKVVPEARGKAAQIIQQADGYKQQVIADAQGAAQRFDSIEAQFKKAPEVTRRRMYLQTMQDVLGNINKVIVDGRNGAGVVPYLPLSQLKTNGKMPAAPGPNAQATDTAAAADNTGGQP